MVYVLSVSFLLGYIVISLCDRMLP